MFSGLEDETATWLLLCLWGKTLEVSANIYSGSKRAFSVSDVKENYFCFYSLVFKITNIRRFVFIIKIRYWQWRIPG